jgi:hypothetical protein
MRMGWLRSGVAVAMVAVGVRVVVVVKEGMPPGGAAAVVR